MTPKNIEIEMFVHFDDGDPAGITFFANFFRIAERALELHLIQNGIPWSDWFDHPEWAIPLKAVQSVFHHPLKPGQKCFVLQKIIQLGHSSLTWEHEIYNEARDLCATLQTTHVFINKVNLTKREIPPPIRLFLESRQET